MEESPVAHKTFVSYKYSEAQQSRDDILEALGSDATYYQGETADSPDLTDEATTTIKRKLTDMMYGTSVTIVVLSPNMTRSKWIDWEIEYCLKEITRSGRTSKTNGLVGVVQKVDGAYEWLATTRSNDDGCRVRTFATNRLYPIINQNRFNLRRRSYSCPQCKTYDPLAASYMSIVYEGDFLKTPQKYIDNAFEKAENWQDFELTKRRS